MTSNQNPALVELLPEIRSASRSVAGRWSNTVSGEDLVQEISVILLRDRYAQRLLGMDLAARRYVLGKIAGRLAAQEATDYEHFSGNFTYSTDEVRTLLAKDALASPGHEVLGGEFVDTNAGDPIAVSACEISVDGIDLRTAFGRLSERQQGLLTDRYVLGVTSPDASVRKELSRAVDALTQEMNQAGRKARQGYEAR